MKQHKNKFVLKRDGQEVCFKFQDGNCTDQGCVRAHECAGCGRNAPWAAMQMQQVRLKPKLAAGLTWAARSGPQSHESGSAPKFQQRATFVSRAGLPQSASVSALSPKPLLVLSSSQTVVHVLSQAFSGHQLASRQEFVSEILHFSLLSSQSGTLPF